MNCGCNSKWARFQQALIINKTFSVTNTCSCTWMLQNKNSKFACVYFSGSYVQAYAPDWANTWKVLHKTTEPKYLHITKNFYIYKSKTNYTQQVPLNEHNFNHVLKFANRETMILKTHSKNHRNCQPSQLRWPQLIASVFYVFLVPELCQVTS